MEKNGKNGTFFYKERKRTERTERSFIKNGKERKRTEKNGKNGTFFYKEWKRLERTERSFEKNGCPTLNLGGNEKVWFYCTVL